jgi:hypothetical protein
VSQVRIPCAPTSVLLTGFSTANVLSVFQPHKEAFDYIRALTPRGRELAPVLYEIARFGLAYLDVPSDDQPLLPHRLTDGLRSLVLVEALPRRRLVAHLALDEGDYTVRVEPPRPGPVLERVTVMAGAPPRADVVVRSSAPVLLWLRRHDITYDDAAAGDLINLDGTARAVDAVRAAFGFSTDA